MKITIELSEQEIKDLKMVSNYFGENDKSPMEHANYAIINDLLKKISSNKDLQSSVLGIDEVKSLIFSGTEKRNGKINLTDDKRSIDWALMRMFDMLSEKTIFNRTEVEELFWARITALANYRDIGSVIH